MGVARFFVRKGKQMQNAELKNERSDKFLFIDLSARRIEFRPVGEGLAPPVIKISFLYKIMSINI